MRCGSGEFGPPRNTIENGARPPGSREISVTSISSTGWESTWNCSCRWAVNVSAVRSSSIETVVYQIRRRGPPGVEAGRTGLRGQPAPGRGAGPGEILEDLVHGDLD